MRKLRFSYLFILFVLITATTATAQEKTLSIDDYGQWSHITGTEISNDGAWMAYALSPNDGNDILYVKSLAGSKVYEVPIGGDAEFSSDNRWVAYTTQPDEQTREKMQENNQRVFETAWLLNLKSGECRR